MENTLLINSVLLTLCLLLGAWRGYRSGVLKITLRLLILCVSYAGAFYGCEITAELLQQRWGWSLVVSYAAAAVVLFLGISLLLGVLCRLGFWWLQRRSKHSAPDASTAGMVLGACLGGFVGFLVIWFVNLLMDLAVYQTAHKASHKQTQHTETAQLKRDNSFNQESSKKDPLKKTAERMVGGLASFAVQTQVDESSILPELAGGFLSNPVAISQGMARLTSNEHFLALFQDKTVQEIMQRKQVTRLIQYRHFRSLLAEPEMQMILLMLSGSASETATDNDIENSPESDTAQHLIAEQLIQLWHKSMGLREHAEFQALVNDPEIQQLLAEPDPRDLLGNEKLQRLAAIVAELDENYSYRPPQKMATLDGGEWSKVGAGQPESSEHQSPKAYGAAEPPAVYRWRDERGRVFYGEEPPENARDVHLQAR